MTAFLQGIITALTSRLGVLALYAASILACLQNLAGIMTAARDFIGALSQPSMSGAPTASALAVSTFDLLNYV